MYVFTLLSGNLLVDNLNYKCVYVYATFKIMTDKRSSCCIFMALSIKRSDRNSALSSAFRT